MNYWYYLKDEYNESIPLISFLLLIWFVICFLYPYENLISTTPKLVGIAVFGIFARSFLKYIKPNIFN